jgi:tetratricopeptide (TPR) repeat protein
MESRDDTRKFLATPREAEIITAQFSLDPDLDYLMVLETGAVWDGQPDEQRWQLEADIRIGFLLDESGERANGCVVEDPHHLDPQQLEVSEVWDFPRFNVPALGMPDAAIGDILLVVQARYGLEEATVDRILFHSAVQAGPPQTDGEPLSMESLESAVSLWRATLEAGDMKAHFGLGYTYWELGAFAAACEHLRVYTELTPHNSWAWCWLGKACAAIGHRSEAAEAYRRAIVLEENGSFETDSDELLAELEG